MKKKIDELHLINFKGASGQMDLLFDPDKPIAVIFGENGTGKSTIVDSIDFVCNEKLGSIEDMSVGQSKAEYIPTIGCSSSSLEVTLVSQGQKYSAVLGKALKPTVSSGGVPLQAHVLRRSRILEIINAQPKDRYNAIKSFVDVPNCERNEESLSRAVKDCNQSLTLARTSLDTAQQGLKRLWEKEGVGTPDFETWAKQRTAIEQSVLSTSLSDRKVLVTAIEDAQRAKTTAETAERSQQQALTTLDQAESRYKVEVERFAEDISSLITVLQDAQTYFSQHPTAQKCPVCEQRIVPQELSRRIDERLAAVQTQVALKEARDTLAKDVETKKSSLDTARRELVKSSIKLRQAIDSCRAMDAKPLKDISTSLDRLVMSKTIDWEGSIPQANRLVTECEAVLVSLKTSNSGETEVVNQYNALKTQLDTIQDQTRLVKKWEVRLSMLVQMLAITTEKRKQFVENILVKISGDVERLYQDIHPNEDIGKIRWYLDPAKRSSLEFKGQFQSSAEVPPPAYYSESHLDSLGICVFIALAECAGAEDAILVLDDVVTSIDQAHLARFFDMLNKESAHFNQVVITTHYRQWRDKYRFAHSSSSQVQLIELQRWTLKSGITHSRTKYAVEELVDLLEKVPFDRQSIAAKAGVLLEAVLDRICRQYECHLPLKRNVEYTLADYAGGISKPLKKVLRVEKENADGTKPSTLLADPVADCTKENWVRNQVGCHFSTNGMDISDGEVEAFGRKVVSLANLLACDRCGEYPYKDSSGSYWECRCGYLKLYPLEVRD